MPIPDLTLQQLAQSGHSPHPAVSQKQPQQSTSPSQSSAEGSRKSNVSCGCGCATEPLGSSTSRPRGMPFSP